MALFTWTVQTAGRPVAGATVTFYIENPNLTAFGEKNKAAIFSNRAMTTAASNPQVADANGEVRVYVPSGSTLAVRSSRSGYGERLDRDRDVTGIDS